MTINNSITDNYGNVWTIVNGVAYINGTLAGYSAGVQSIMEYPANGPNPVVYQYNGTSWWGAFGITSFLANGSSLVWTGPQADPRTLPLPGSPPPPTSSIMLGVDISGMELSPIAVSENGYSPPTKTDWSYLASKGVNLVRLALAWENIQPTLSSPLSSSYMTVILNQLSLAAANGIKVVVDIHNSGHYVPNSIWSTSWQYAGAAGNTNNSVPGTYVLGDSNLTQAAFVDLWTRLATYLVGNAGLGAYGLMNEPVGLANNNIWPPMAQAAINAIRAIDTATPITVMGPNGYGDYGLWVNGNNFPLTGTNLIYEAHFYFDGEGDTGNGGNYSSTFSALNKTTNSGVVQATPFVQFLQTYNLKGYAGEFGVPNDSNDNDQDWIILQNNFVGYLVTNKVWCTTWLYGTPGVANHVSGNILNIVPIGGVDDPRLTGLISYL
jgi:endoglucanase